MDVPATIEFLLAEGARQDARQAEFSRELRLMARLGQRAFRDLAEAQRRLTDQQRETEARLNAVIHLFERHVTGDNGGPRPR